MSRCTSNTSLADYSSSLINYSGSTATALVNIDLLQSSSAFWYCLSEALYLGLC